jgi:hypothetical protein
MIKNYLAKLSTGAAAAFLLSRGFQVLEISEVAGPSRRSVRSTLARGAGELHQLVTERDALCQVGAERSLRVFAQALHPYCLGPGLG